MKRMTRQDTNVSLFPFLAVLMCTMGALIVLLVVMVEQARVQAKSISVESQLDQPTLQQQQAQIDMIRGQQELLAAPLAGFVEQLEGDRLRLTHVEDHLRALREELEQLRRRAETIAKSDERQDVGAHAQKDQLASLKVKIEQSKRRLEQARQRAQNRPRSYALVPYDGQNGTVRRPIYVECFADRVVLQPEGTTLYAGDFSGPGGAGNPLAAALRATREHWALQRGVDHESEPYPLLVVRPDAAEMYAQARNAMKSWGSDFGYELVTDDLNLAYPAADPALAQTQRQAVEMARHRKAQLARAAPRQYGGYSGPSLRASGRHGGFVLDGGSEGRSHSDRPRSGSPQGRNSSGGGAGQGTGKAGDSLNAQGKMGQGANQASGSTGQPAGSHKGTSEQAGADGNGGTAQSPSSQSHSSGGGAAGGRPNAGKAKGKNWGLPNSSRGATGFTRPIRVRLEKGQLIILPEGRSQARPQVVTLDGPLAGRIDDFISAVWEHMEGWGIAGPNAYWKPVLNVDVAPNLHAEYAELRALLQGSGIRLERKTW